jgi:hypothetical protein
MIVLQNPVLAAGSFTHSTVRHPFLSAGYTSLLPHFFISVIPPASAPRSKSPAFAPLHKSLPIPFPWSVTFHTKSSHFLFPITQFHKCFIFPAVLFTPE